MNFVDRLFLKDARKLLQVLPQDAPCVDVTVTSPPYWNLKDYGTDNQIGYGQTKEEYLNDIKTVLKNCLLVTKDTGSLWLVVDDYRENGVLQLLPWELAECARSVGWKLRDLIVWDKQHSVPWHRNGQMRNVVEFIIFMTKSDDYKYRIDRVKMLDELSKWWVDFPERFNPKGKTPTNIWSFPIRTQGKWCKPSDINHDCPFSTALVTRILELTTDPGDLVMDPFAGSGVALAQAAAMGRHFVGFEISKKYVEMFRKIVKKEVAAEWAEIQSWRERQGQAESRVYFEETVMKLRALKYARQVTKPFLEKRNLDRQPKIEAIVCLASIPEHFCRERPFDVTVWVVVQQGCECTQETLQDAVERSKRPPLSQYGISSEIKVGTYSDLKNYLKVNSRSKRLGPKANEPKLQANSISSNETTIGHRTRLSDQEFYLYLEYKPHKYTARDTLRNWFKKNHLSGLTNGKIPMLANVAVDVAWVLES